MKNKAIMTMAWEIAKEGAKKYGGNVKEYFAQALVMAWNEAKNTKAKLVITAGSRKHKSWVAAITGTHAQYKFNRFFIKEVDWNLSEKHFELGNGVYDVCDAGKRYFVEVKAGKLTHINVEHVKEVI